jgi:signal transduction histidine kinase
VAPEDRYRARVSGVDGLIERCRRLPPLVVDLLLTVVVAVVTVVSVVVADQQDEGVSMTGLGWALLAAQLVPLVWRRRAPVIVAVTTLCAAAWYGAIDLPDPPLMFGPLLATYTLAAYRPRRITVPTFAAVVVGIAIVIVFGDESDAADIAVGYFAGITAWVAGDTMRGQRERAAWMEARRADDARRVAMTERLAIARDLHDIVAHNVSVIAVQAEAAQEVFSTRPERAEQAMADVADTARTALTELRRLLGVLRSDRDLAPQPGLDAIDDLVASVRRAGVDVQFARTGREGPVDAVAGLTAYRVVQEALTNVMKHAGPCTAAVEVALNDDSLLVSVSDDGAGSSAPDRGHGLVGMRERVSVLGGSLDAGARAGGGFEVRARLPLSA